MPITYKIFEANFRKIDIFQNFDNKSLQLNFKSESLMFWGFFWGAACLSSSKNDESRILIYYFSYIIICYFWDLLRPNDSLSNLIKVSNDHSFYMKCLLLVQDKNWSVMRWYHPRTASDMDRTLHNDLAGFENIRGIIKVRNYHVNNLKS